MTDPVGVALLADGETVTLDLGCDACGEPPWRLHAMDCPVLEEREALEGLEPDGWRQP